MAIRLNGLDMLLTDQGHYKEAGHLHGRALAIRERVLGEEHPDAAASLSNLANVLYDQ